MSRALFSVEYRDRVTNSVGKFKLTVAEDSMLYFYFGGEGRLFFFVNDRLLELLPGDVIFIKKGTLIASVKKNPVRYTRLVSYFPDSFLEYLSAVDSKLIRLNAIDSAAVFSLSGIYKDKLYTLLSDCINKPVHGTDAMALIIKELAILADSGFNDNIDHQAADLLSGILKRINEDYRELSSGADVARAMGYSQNYISEYFKNKLNISLHEFLKIKKLSVALTKMSEGSSVTDAAYESGFSSSSHFIEVFKSHYGLTPKHFLNQIREK